MKILISLFVLLLLESACQEKKQVPKTENKWDKNTSVDYNKEINEREAIQIALFLDHHTAFKMTQTTSGLRYMIYKDSISKQKPTIGQQVYIDLRIELLDGTICYVTDSTKNEVFAVDKSDNESGLNEAVKLLSVGDKAKLILPSHLAHGLLGDFDKIPPQSILLLDIQLNKIR